MAQFLNVNIEFNPKIYFMPHKNYKVNYFFAKIIKN